MEPILYVSGAVGLIATAMVITRVKAVHAVLYLVVSLLAVAVVLFAAGAPLAGAFEIIIYAGAIMVLFIYVLMLLNLGQPAARDWLAPKSWLGPAALVLVLGLEFLYLIVLAPDRPHAASFAAVPVHEVSRALFTTYLLAVELASVILLATLVAAYHLARRPDEGDER